MNITKHEQTMSSREIAELVESRHDSVKRSMERLAESGVISVTPMVEPLQNGGKPTTVLHVSKRDSYVVVAQLSPQFTARLVDRWQELESAAAQQAPALPQTYVEALEHLLESKKAEAAALAQLEAAKPAVEFVERYVEASGLFGFRQVCKQLGAKEPKFRAFLQSQRIMYRLGNEWTPHAQWLTAGYFATKTGEANGHAFSDPKFTPKGVEWITRKWAEYLERNQETGPSLLDRALADNRLR